MADDVPYVAIGAGEDAPWVRDNLDLACPDCGGAELPLRDSDPPGLTFIKCEGCGGLWLRGRPRFEEIFSPASPRRTQMLPEHREYYARQNKYGGWEVVDQHGRKAPKPNGYNLGDTARWRAAELNRAEGAMAADSAASRNERQDG